MARIDELFQEKGNQLYEAFLKGSEPTRAYEKTVSHIYKPDTARFKMVVWFKDGNRRYFYSYDNKHFDKHVIVDEYEAFVKLLRLVKKYEGQHKNIIIYANLDPKKTTSGNYNHEILKVDRYENKKTNKLVSFLESEKNITLDVQRLFNLSNSRI